MMKKLPVVAMLLVITVIMSGSWTWATARPLEGDQARAREFSSGVVDSSPALPTHWHGRMLSQLEEKGPRGCPKTHDPTTPCSSP
jgi:hypothetical protein